MIINSYFTYRIYLFFLQFSCIDTYWRCATCWCFWDQGSRRVSFASGWWSRWHFYFFVTLYFYFELYDTLSLSVCTHIYLCMPKLRLVMETLRGSLQFFFWMNKRIFTNCWKLRDKYQVNMASLGDETKFHVGRNLCPLSKWGLAVRHQKLFNEALLRKWLWWFGMEREAL